MDPNPTNATPADHRAALNLTALLLVAGLLLAAGPALADDAGDDGGNGTFSTLKAEFTRDTDQTVIVLAEPTEPDEDEDQAKDDGDDEAGCKDEQKKDPWFEGEFSGELEYRYSRSRRPGDGPNTSQDLGVSLGYEFNVRRDWDFAVAFKSGADRKPNTGWIDLDDPDGQQWLFLREAWGRYRIDLGRGTDLHIQAGNFSQPDAPTQLVFDSDLHRPSLNLALAWKPANGSLDEVGLAVNAMRLRGAKQEVTEDDTLSFPAAEVVSTQLNLEWDLTKQTRMETAVALHTFHSPGSIHQAVIDEDWQIGGFPGDGETTNYLEEDGSLSSDYRVLDAWIGTEFFRGTDWPLEVEVEYLHNTAAGGTALGRDDAWYAGATLGDDEKPGDWRCGVEYAYLEPDAVFAPVNRGGYATNHSSTRLDVRYVPWEDVTWRLTHQWAYSIFDDAPLGANDEQETRLYVTYEW